MKNKEIVPETKFTNCVIDKSQLKKLIAWAFRTYGITRAANMADSLKALGFHYATKAGISLSLEDLRIPPAKKQLLDSTIKEVKLTEYKYNRGEITVVERFQKVIDTWNNASETLKNKVLQYFRNTDPLNPVYMMAFSGARGNVSQVRQLVGMRGLMSDPQGQIIDLPIASNFREGLTVTEYFISSYGARKGLVDTALRTADSGYLTRRLVDVAQDMIIREIDCGTKKGVILEDMVDNQKTLIPLEQSLVGRILAENIYCRRTGQLIAKANQDIGPDLAKKIVNANSTKILVRSPLTCESRNSVCQYCYGWNLAHGRLVDLGEAVGIIAAQSIGEPGTQLTMRTFHTGGVFTGELADPIHAPSDGILCYPDNYKLVRIRTRHGESAFNVEEPMQLTIKAKQQNYQISLSEGSILFYQDNASVEKGIMIAESPINARLENAQKHIVSDLSGQVYFLDLTVEETNNKHHTTRITQKGGILWVLSGKVYDIPDIAEIIVEPGGIVNQNSILAQVQLKNKYAGQILFNKDSEEHITEIQIITDWINFSDLYIYWDSLSSKYLLKTKMNEKFVFKIHSKDKIYNGQIIGDLISNTYNTPTGGIVKYLDLPVSKYPSGNEKDAYEILGPGYVLLIPEETHEVNKDISLLLVENHQCVEPGTEIVKNNFCSNGGIVNIIHKDDIIKEIIIKPGKLYPISDVKQLKSKTRGFLRPGEKIQNNLVSDKLVYWELIHKDSDYFMLIRPVIVYSIPERVKSIEEEFKQLSFSNQLSLKLSRRISFKDGERIRSIKGVDLIQTHLVVSIQNPDPLLISYVEFFPKEINNEIFSLKLTTIESIALQNEVSGSQDLNRINKKNRILVENNTLVAENTVIAQTEILSTDEGEIKTITSDLKNNRRILVVTQKDIESIRVKDSSTTVKIGDWIYSGDKIAENINASHCGQIIKKTTNEVVLRIAQPYLVSDGTILYVNHNDLLQNGETLAVLVYKRAKTGDIVQGLPRIEEILEARKKIEGHLNPHDRLDTAFTSYYKAGLDLYDAAQLSFKDIQAFLMNEIQLVYQSQNVDISDKHIEVIVRQMTSKVKTENGGETGYLPGEIVELEKINDVNKTMVLINKLEATYWPILLGITKASLNTNSFISAASFQETTKVLTEAAISGRLDWLRGLKENVIIGRLIPAGTGFNMHNQDLQIKNTDLILDKQTAITSLNLYENNGLEDIIFDDRISQKYYLSSTSCKMIHHFEDL